MSNPPDVMQLKTELSDDKNGASLTLLKDGVPLGHIILQPADLDGLIRMLAQVRASMAEPFPPDVDPGSRISAVHDPIWRLRLMVPEGVLLLLQHPGLGWLGNLFPAREARTLAQSLSTLSDQL